MTANPLFRKAIVRAALAALAVAVWTVFFDGPAWAWLLLIAYIGVTFTIAWALTRYVASKTPNALTEDDG